VAPPTVDWREKEAVAEVKNQAQVGKACFSPSAVKASSRNAPVAWILAFLSI
jgi:hypothetical protein